MRILRITLVSLVALIAATLLGRNIPSVFAADPAPAAKPAAAKAEKGQGIQFEIVAADSPVDELLAEMNGSTGAKKIDAMAALLNRLVQERKSKGRFSGVMRLQLGSDGPDKASGHSESPSDAEKAIREKRSDVEQAAAAARAQAEQSVAEARHAMENAVAQMRAEAERAVAQAHEQVAQAHAERDEARHEAERAKAEARELAKKLGEEQRAASK